MAKALKDSRDASAPEPGTPAPGGRPRRRARALLVRLGALAVGLLLAAALAELMVLVFVGEQVKFPRHVVEAPWGLRYNEPGSRYRHKSADGTWYFQINGQGMRADRDIPHAKPPGVRRIVSLGDSFAIGYEVDAEQTFARVLERELNRAGCRVEVLNAGVSGFSNAEECLYLERELLKYDPDLVLVSFYSGNDLSDNIRTGLFGLDAQGRLVERSRKYVPAGRLGNFLNTNPVFNLLSERSNAFALLKEQLTLMAKRGMVRKNEEQLAEAAQGEDEKKGGPRTDDQDAGQRLEERLAAAILDRIYDDTRARGIPLIIQSIPAILGYPDRKLVDRFPAEDFDTEREGLIYLPTADLLRPYLNRERLYNRRSHFHWTPLSHELDGKALARLILDRGLLCPPPAPSAAADAR